MPKETSRTKKVKAALARLISEKSDWDPKELRTACLASLDPADAAERQKYSDSIRYLVAQMRKGGALDAKTPPKNAEQDDFAPIKEPTSFEILVSDEPSNEPAPQKERAKGKRRVRSAKRTEAGAPKEEAPDTAAEAQETAPAAASTEAAPAKEPSPAAKEAEKPPRIAPAYRGPKGKDMKLYLAELLTMESALSEDVIFSAAVRRFGAVGEHVNGVGGLAKQQLREGVKEGWLLGSPKEGYRLKPSAETAAEPAPAEPDAEALAESKPEPALPEPASPEPVPAVPARARARKTAAAKPLRKPPEPQPREAAAPKLGAPLNEMRFAELLSKRQQSLQKQTGDNTFFAEFSARLLEAHFRARGLTVTGRFVVDGADDKGADVILHTVDELGIADVVLVQAKTRTVGQVTLKELREFFGVMSSQRATRGIFITTSSFTTDAVTFIRENPGLGAIDKHKLFDLARAYGVGILLENGACIPDPSIFS